MNEHTGRCLCGAVRYRAAGVETQHHACHCESCRRWGSAPFFAVFAATVSFEGQEDIRRYPSSDWAERGFCKRCGSNLFYYLKPADAYHLAAGTFDDQSELRLATEYFIDYKPEGYALAGDLERLTEAEVIARYAPPEK